MGNPKGALQLTETNYWAQRVLNNYILHNS